jgi:hypothetical protein
LSLSAGVGFHGDGQRIDLRLQLPKDAKPYPFWLCEKVPWSAPGYSRTAGAH